MTKILIFFLVIDNQYLSCNNLCLVYQNVLSLIRFLGGLWRPLCRQKYSFTHIRPPSIIGTQMSRYATHIPSNNCQPHTYLLAWRYAMTYCNLRNQFRVLLSVCEWKSQINVLISMCSRQILCAFMNISFSIITIIIIIIAESKFHARLPRHSNDTCMHTLKVKLLW